VSTGYADVSNEHFVRLSSESTSPTTSGQPDHEDGPITLPETSANYNHNYNYNDNMA